MTSAREKRFGSFVAAASAAFGAAILLAAPSAHASGIEHGTTGVIYRVVFKMKAGVDYQFRTRNLTPGSDTVIHVLKYPDGEFIAAGNDTVIFDGGPIILPDSTVEVDRATADRTVYLIVRGMPGTADGSADFRILGVTDTAVVKETTTRVNFSAGFVKTLPSIAAKTHITTVEEPIGTTDSIVMVFGNNNPLAPIAFDDDDGIDNMSFARLASACTSNCQIVVGTPNPWIRILGTTINRAPGPVRLIWDENIENGDSDIDGLSNELETNVTHTSPSNRDTDADGILDGFEVYGAILAGSGRGGSGTPPAGGGKDGNLLKFPKYGADPLAKDVFIEADWAPACPGASTTCAPGSFTSGKDDLKYSAREILRAAGSMSTAGIRAHFDAGIPGIGDVDTMFGDWGGANRLPDGDVTFTSSGGNINGVYIEDGTFGGVECGRGTTFARQGLFHHFISIKSRPRSPYGRCGTALPDGGTLTHEIGHNFNLRHGGPKDSADYDVNCKVNYASVMSYPNQFLVSDGIFTLARGYSVGLYANRPVNGFSMNEVAGLGNTPEIIAFGPNGSFDRGFADTTTFPTGIDWNMDGRIDATPVRAPANWATTTCAAPYMRANWSIAQPRTNAFGPGFRSRTVAEATAAAPELIYASGGGILIGTADASRCTSTAGQNSCTLWSSRTSVPSTLQITSSPSVAGPFFVFRESGGRLAVIRRVPPAENSNSRETFVRPTILGGPTITGDPAAIDINGVVKVYAISGGRLMRWEFDPTLNGWVRLGTPEVWEDGTPVLSTFGITVIHGADQMKGLGVFAAIPDANGVAAGNPVPIELARLESTPITVSFLGGLIKINTTSDLWRRFPALGGGNRPSTQGAKPGLAYVPFDLTVPVDGRFYLTAVLGGVTGIIFTEGNGITGAGLSRQLIWKPGQTTSFTDAKNQARQLPGGVRLGRFGASVVGANANLGGISYFPAADGIYNLTYRDIDEGPFVRGNLRCSLSDCD